MNNNSDKDKINMKEEKSDSGKVLDGFLALSNLALRFSIYLSKLVWRFILFLGDVFEKKFTQKSRKRK